MLGQIRSLSPVRVNLPGLKSLDQDMPIMKRAVNIADPAESRERAVASLTSSNSSSSMTVQLLECTLKFTPSGVIDAPSG